MSLRVPLTLACWDYDRTLPLAQGDVRPSGVDLTYLTLPVEETFFRMLRFREFEAAELSLSSYVLSLDGHGDGAGGAPFVAIPVFPSRAFRHNGIYIHAGRGVTEPADLAGRQVGVPEYQLTAAVWIRGILAERHGLPVAAVRYRTGGLHQPGRTDKISHSVPPGVEITPIPAGQTLAGMLAEGSIDALYSPRTPRPFAAGDPRVARLFAEPRLAEEQYYAATGIFPIMHVVVLRRDVYQRWPWLARSLLAAFEEARALTVARMAETAATRYLLPWLYADLERTQQVMGTDFWSYGLTPDNEHTLRTFLRYSHEQGLASRLFEPAELFAPETLESPRV
jgi:4,5-dihydroxyphthalate decarboxylase